MPPLFFLSISLNTLSSLIDCFHFILLYLLHLHHYCARCSSYIISHLNVINLSLHSPPLYCITHLPQPLLTTVIRANQLATHALACTYTVASHHEENTKVNKYAFANVHQLMHTRGKHFVYCDWRLLRVKFSSRTPSCYTGEDKIYFS